MGNRSDKIPHKEVQFLNAVTIFQKGEIKRFYKDFLKNWPDGCMDLQTFKDFLQRFFKDNADNFADHYFRTIDKDKSGKINFTEFLLYLSAEGSSNPFDRITWMFDLFDMDGSGRIDRKEMTAIFESALKMSKEDAEAGSAAEAITEEIFKRYDRDKNDTIEKHEFRDAILENRQLFSIFPVVYDAIFKKETQ